MNKPLILLPESWEQGCTLPQSRTVHEAYMQRGRISLNRWYLSCFEEWPEARGRCDWEVLWGNNLNQRLERRNGQQYRAQQKYKFNLATVMLVLFLSVPEGINFRGMFVSEVWSTVCRFRAFGADHEATLSSRGAHAPWHKAAYLTAARKQNKKDSDVLFVI